jgi:hypothetical protein
LRFFTRCVAWRAVGTVRALVAFWTLCAFTTRLALLTWFTRLAWLRCLASFLRGLLV